MELITPTTAKVLAYYDHPVWGKYAAVTENNYGKGIATYIGCITSDTIMKNIIADATKKAGLFGIEQQLSFPVITKKGVNQNGRMVHYYFNYSATAQSFNYPYNSSKELITNKAISKNATLQLPPWGVMIIEEN